MGGLHDELLQRPLIQPVLVAERHDSYALKALLNVYGLREVVKDGVKHLRWWGLEQTSDVDIGRRLVIKLFAPLFNRVGSVLGPTLTNFHAVKHDCSIGNVWGSLGSDLGLVGHLGEGHIIDREIEDIRLHVVVELNLPSELIFQ